MFYDVKIKSGGAYTPRKIEDIKALRSAVRLPAAIGGENGPTMGLTEAKAAIEHGYANGSFILRLTAEQYAALAYNGRERGYMGDWYIDTVTSHFPEPEIKVFTV